MPHTNALLAQSTRCNHPLSPTRPFPQNAGRVAIATSSTSNSQTTVVVTSLGQDVTVTVVAIKGLNSFPSGYSGYDLATCFANTSSVSSNIVACRTVLVSAYAMASVTITGLSAGQPYTIAALPQAASVAGQVCDPVSSPTSSACAKTGPWVTSALYAAPAPPPPSPPPPSPPPPSQPPPSPPPSPPPPPYDLNSPHVTLALANTSNTGTDLRITAGAKDASVTYVVLKGLNAFPSGYSGYDLATCFANTSSVSASKLACGVAVVGSGTTVVVHVTGESRSDSATTA